MYTNNIISYTGFFPSRGAPDAMKRELKFMLPESGFPKSIVKYLYSTNLTLEMALNS